jgi:hypothetical protein
MQFVRKIARGAAPLGLAGLALASTPAHAQWNYYANGGSSFYVPFVAGGSPDFRYVSLTLPYGTGSKTTAFVMDTGSLGILAGTNAYSPGAGDIPLGPGGITYTSDGTSGAGNLFLTPVARKPYIMGFSDTSARSYPPMYPPFEACLDRAPVSLRHRRSGASDLQPLGYKRQAAV